MSDDWGSWGPWEPPKGADETPEETPVETPPEETPQEPAFPEWPVVGPASSSNYPPYGQLPTEPQPWDDFPPGPTRRSRDPLGRLFPGLSRGTRVTLDWFLTIAGAVLIVLALKQWVVNPYRIPSSSMEPYLNCAKPESGCLGDSSDRVLACRICLDFSNPSRTDVVVFNTPPKAVNACGEGGTFVKRVIGLPGETVKEDDKGFIWIRGPDSKRFVKLNEPYIPAKQRREDVQQNPQHRNDTWPVPKDEYFMMGDNRGFSCDSRTWGSVPRSDLIGTVFFVYWPPDRIGFK